MDQESLYQESEEIQAQSVEYAQFYALTEGVHLKEITAELLSSAFIKEGQKQILRKLNRRVFVFTYPSDGLKIKGLISFVSEPQHNPTLLFLRGGNRTFGITNPASDLMSVGDYTVITTTYRGGVSEGHDEFGGRDVDDVKNLILFLPELAKQLDLPFKQEKMFLLGRSRGGMEMFLTLARFPELQARFAKIVSLSGLLDLRETIAKRPDMKQMFIDDFGLVVGSNEEQWISWRDPQLTASKIDPTLPILIIQGTDDNRVSLAEGYHMVSQLQSHGCHVSYLEIKGADHCLANQDNYVALILDWLNIDPKKMVS